jgi:hypothetical protein
MSETAGYRGAVRLGHIPAHIKTSSRQSRVLHGMERPQTLPNIWAFIQTAAWIMALDGVAEFFSERHSNTLIRRLIALLLDRDPASPRLPDSWEDWYNS